jgi:N-acetylmuramoyl-L-alanine amidase
LAQRGFGLWCECAAAAAPAGFDALLGLQALGYDISAPAAARQAFRRHFLASDGDTELAPGEQALLHCLLQKKAQRAILPLPSERHEVTRYADVPPTSPRTVRRSAN